MAGGGLFIAQSKPVTMRITSGDQSTTSNVAGNITDLVYGLDANALYTVSGMIKIGCSGAGGVKLAVTVPSGAIFNMLITGSTSATTAFIAQNHSASGTLSTTAYNTEAQTRFVTVSGYITTAGTAGNLQFQHASGTNLQTSTTYQFGTFLKIERVA